MSKKKENKVINYKPILLAAIIVIFVIILDFITVNNTKKIIGNMNENLDEIDNLLSDNKSAVDSANDLLEKWEKSYKLMSYYLEHDEIEKIGNNINLIQKQIEIEDYDDARQSITETKFLFDHLEEKQILNIENFF